MGKIPKDTKPKAYFWPAVASVVLTLAAINCVADSGQAAMKRGNYGAAAAQFMYKAKRNDPVAQNNLGVLYLKGRGVTQNYALALEWFEKAADAELAGAMFNIGIVYLRGYGMEPDIGRSTEWFERGAMAGDREAQFFFGLHLYHGRGTGLDLETALEWFQKAAAQGLGSAQYNLAVMLLRGESGAPDEAGALELLRQAAAQGHELADLTIGQIYLARIDDPNSATLAREVFQRLAEHGNADAQVTLGMIYTFGQGGVPQDFDEGRFWLKLASNQNSAPARLNLGNIYAQGIGVERDLIRAYAWYSLSAKIGDAAGQNYRDTLAQELDQQELGQARLLAIELADTIPSLGSD